MASKGKSSEVGSAHIKLTVEGAEKVREELQKVRKTTEQEMGGAGDAAVKASEGVTEAFDNVATSSQAVQEEMRSVGETTAKEMGKTGRSTKEAADKTTGAFEQMATSVDRGVSKLTKFTGIITGVIGALALLYKALETLAKRFDVAGQASAALGDSLGRVDYSAPANAVRSLAKEAKELRDELGKIDGNRSITNIFNLVSNRAAALEKALDGVEERLAQARAIEEKDRLRGLSDEILGLNLSIAEDPEVRRELQRQQAIEDIRKRKAEADFESEKTLLDSILGTRLRAIDDEYAKRMEEIEAAASVEQAIRDKAHEDAMRKIAREKTARLQAAIEEGRQLEENARRYREGLTRAIDSAFNSLDSRVQASFGLETLVVEMQAIGEQLDAIRNNTGGI